MCENRMKDMSRNTKFLFVRISDCYSYQHRCPRGNCTSTYNLCNGRNDCGDWSDELLPQCCTSRITKSLTIRTIRLRHLHFRVKFSMKHELVDVFQRVRVGITSVRGLDSAFKKNCSVTVLSTAQRERMKMQDAQQVRVVSCKVQELLHRVANSGCDLNSYV